MDFNKYETKGWFKEIRKNKKEFYRVDNLIESAKEKFNRQNHVYEWITGIAIGILLSISLADLIQNTQKWLSYTAIILYFICIIVILMGLFLYQKTNSRLEIILIWLYREKDKQDKNFSNSKKLKRREK